MPPVIQFGIDSVIDLHLADGVLVAECGAPRTDPLEDPAQAVAQALADPLDFPPLAKGTTPGDRVVVTLGHDVPRAAQVVGAAVEYLVQGGVQPDGISVLQSQCDVEAGTTDVCRLLPAKWRDRITRSIHDPTDRGRLAYLAATDAGEPILLNRAITDADVVLPIGAMNRRKEAGCFGIHSTVFPAFSDQRALARFRSRGALETDGPRKKRLVDEANQVGWLLGVTFTIQVIPGPGDTILHVVAGEVGAVARRCHALYREAWGCAVPRRASLVVAAIQGGPVQQTWHNFGQALAAAAPLVEDGGAIAVCSDIVAAPGPGIQRLAGSRSRGAALRTVVHERLEDALQALQLVQTLKRARVYLLSGLDREMLEELDIAPIGGPAELARLAARHPSCIVLANAPLAMVSVEDGQ